MKIQAIEQGSIGTNCYIVYDESSKKAFCVDVSDHISQRYLDFIRQKQLEIEYVLLTHGHYDHGADLNAFHQAFPAAKIVMSKIDYESILSGLSVFCNKRSFITPSVLLEGGEELPFLNKKIKVINTPGHTSGSVCYLFENALFCGDTVFDGSIGRTDLPTGSFFDIMKSVAKINELGDYKLFPGHMSVTDIPTQRKVNPYFR